MHRHCMVVHAYYPIGETRVEREALALVSRGAEVDVICLKMDGEPSDEDVAGVRVHRLPVGRNRGQGAAAQLFEYLSFFLLAFVQLNKLHRRAKFDVVQVHNLPDFLVFVAVLQKLGGAKIILDLHDLMPEFYAEQFQRPLNHPTVRLIRLEEWLSCKFADHIITVTELWRQALIKRGQPAGKISVVMNVADDQIFNRNVQAAPPQDGFFHLIYHGIVGRRQGLDLLLRAMDKIRAEAPNIFLLLHGWGEYRETLMSLAADLQIQDRVDFSLKRLQSEELPALLKQAHLAVVPYRNGVFTGGILPTKLMEYAALGVPSIAARTPGISHYFEDDQVCFFTPENVDELAACILDLYRDRAQLDVLARNIARFPARYEWSRLSSDYVALVERVRSTSRADMQARWSHG